MRDLLILIMLYLVLAKIQDVFNNIKDIIDKLRK